MPNSSEVEDIFAESGELTTPEYTVPVAKSSRRGLVIALIVLALLLLLGGGIFLAIWLWPKATTVDTANLNVGEVNTNQNVNSVVVTVNTNEVVANSNVNSAPSFVDVDHDGLTDEEELQVNTNPKKKDTDDDGLSDREEVRVYGTDPRNTDTDGDGYMDGDEVTHFYHPNHPDPKKRLFDLP